MTETAQPPPHGAAQPPSAQALPQAAHRPARGLRLAGMKLLVVDDLAANCEFMCGLLAMEGAWCQPAHSGPQALELLRAAARAQAFDGVFMDVQMPVMDGLETTRHIRADPALAGLPVIAVSANAQPQQRHAALEAGMDYFLAKPIELNTLVTVLRLRLQLRQGGPGPATTLPAAQAPAADSAVAVAPPLPSVPGLDMARVSQRLMGLRGLFLGMLRSLRDDFGDVAQHTRDDVTAGRLAAAGARLHRLRGLTGNLAAQAVFTQATRLENALREGRHFGLEPVMDALEAAMREVLDGLPADVDLADGDLAEALEPRADADLAAITALVAALDEGDMAAQAHYQALRPTLATRHGAAALQPLDDAMDRLRFAQARSTLRAWYPAD